MKRPLTIVAAVALAALLAGSAVAQMGPGPQVPMGPGSDQMQKMMQTMSEMQGQMRQMQEQMKGMSGMGPMQGRMGQMMGMMGQMRGMMAQHQEMLKQVCPGAAGVQAPK